ncbi:MAG: hypothetical protein ACXABN_18300, partial [Candidatus Thorarchaeota archaeon]
METAVRSDAGIPTYNGTQMTDSGVGKIDGGEAAVEVWYLVGPDTGSPYDVSIPNSGGQVIACSIMSFTSTGTPSKDSANS